jgi:3-phosphoshikimate 1-carboxyvinyltransferase
MVIVKMEVRIKKIEGVKGAVHAPPSKSYTHRAFVISSLARGRSIIKNYLKAQDTYSTLKACKGFGVRIEGGEEIVIHGSDGELHTPASEIDVENSGTTLRFISGLAALDGEVTITGDESIQKRPMQPLLDALNQLGVEAFSTKKDGTPPIVIKGGGIKGGEVKIRGDISSQFISSLLISSPYAKNDVKIRLTTPLKSRPYVDLTLDVMEKFGVTVKNKDYMQFYVKAGKGYRGREYAVEGDYSSAGYFLALAALTNSEITVANLFRESMQGDRVILDILKRMGAKIKAKSNEVTVVGRGLEGIEVDLGDTPDLLPTVSALAAKAEGTTTIKNVEHARYKECNRLSACATEFGKLGITIVEKKDGLVIQGTGKLTGARVQSHNDHRMAMALTIAGLCAEGETIVEDADPVKISFPEFFDTLKSLGIKIVFKD